MEESKIVKYIVGEADANEILVIENWLKENPANLESYLQLEKTWKKSKAIKNITFDTAKAWKNFESNQINKPKTRHIQLNGFIKYAAAAIVLLGIIFTWNYLQKPKLQIASNYNKAMKTIALADGTNVKLLEGELNYPHKFDDKSRNVQLKGNAFFKVAKNLEKPFSINAGDCQIKVLGTAFEIKENKKYVKVEVMEGKVAFITPNGEIILLAGESADYNILEKSLKNFKTKENHFSFINKKLKFKNIPLKEAVLDIEELYKIDIEIKNKNIENQLINTQFNDESLENVLEVLSSTLGIKVTKSSNQIIIE